MTVKSRLARLSVLATLSLTLPLGTTFIPVMAHAEVSAADPLKPTGAWSIPQRKQAQTPPMGWNSWNAFRTEIDEAKVMGAAQALVDSGLATKGYVYVNLDDGWWLKRRQSDNRMQIRTNLFPSAKTGGTAGTSFRPFTDKLHGMGLKAGIYTDVGHNACSQAYDLHSPNLPEGTTAEREVGLYGHVDQDIALYFAEWGFDYIKVDACGINVYAPNSDLVKTHAYNGIEPMIDQNAISRTDITGVRNLYDEVATALDKHNPDGDYILALCNWGTADVRTWGKQTGHMWRTSGDITPTWTRMLHNFDSASTRSLYAQAGAWNDPDILFIGHGEFDANHLVQARAHFALWAMINAPLLISYDLRSAPQSLMDIWGNADIIALNQDKGGHQAVIAYATDDVQILVKSLSSGQKATVLFNRTGAPITVNLTAEHLKYLSDQPVQLKDLWSKDTQSFTGETTFTLAPYETRIFTTEGTRRLNDGVFLSEIPGQINVAEDGITAPMPDPVVHRMTGQWSGTRGTGERPAYTGWGGAQADSTPYDQTLQVAGQRFDTGIGILAGSRLEVRNLQNHTHFDARVGIDDSTLNTTDRVRFLVYGDGKLLAQSAEIGFGTAAQPLTANISGVKIIELVVRADNRQSDQPVVTTWAEAALRK